MFVDLDKDFPSPDPKHIEAGLKYLMSEIKDGMSISRYGVFTICLEWNSPYYVGESLMAINSFLAKKGWVLRVLEETPTRVIYKVSPTREFMESALKDMDPC